MHYVYIIQSEKTNRFYIGETTEIHQRLRYHNSKELNTNSTKSGIPWSLFLTIEVKDRIHGRKVESKIKKMKSRVYIENLAKYPEMIEKLLRL
jgi:putative endonuclease